MSLSVSQSVSQSVSLSVCLSVCLSVTYLSEDQVSDLVVDEAALGEVDEAVRMKVGIAIVQKSQIRHI